jgi:alanine dehydrogenase
VVTGRTLPWLTDDDVRALVPLTDAIPAVAAIIQREVDGTARAIPKAMTTWEPSSAAHALGAYDECAGLVGFKTWVNTPQGAAALMTLFRSTDGSAVAVMEAVAIGLIRTASVAGIATRLMSDPGATELAIIGSGRQALLQVAAVAAVRPLTRVRVWSPRESSRTAFAATIRAELGLEATASDTLEDALRGAPIVTLITRAKEPFLPPNLLARGAHLNAVGAILPQSAEFDSAILADSDLTVVDNLENARRVSRELRDHYADDWTGVRTLGEMISGAMERPPSPSLTVFKGVGVGLGDLAVAALALEASEVAR